MELTNNLERQGHRMLQLGVAMMAIVAVEGFAIPALALPRTGLSVHTLGTLQALLFLALGLVWPRLALGRTASLVAWWTYVYSSFATWAAYVLAAVWGAGGTTMPLPTGGARGSAAQEMAIRLVIFSSAPTFFVAIAIIMRGLRLPSAAPLVAHHEPMRGTAR